MTDRRRFLAGLPAVALAGCLADDRRGEQADGGGTGTDDGQSTDEATPAPPESVDGAWPAPGYDAGRGNYAPGADGPPGPVAEVWRTPVDAALSGPVVADGTVYVGGGDGTVRALDARTGTPRWTDHVDGAAGIPWVHGGQVVVPAGDAVASLSAADGGTHWRVEARDLAGLLVASHGVYHVTAGEDPTLVALAHDGTERWRTRLADPWAPPPFDAGGQVVVPSGTHDSVPWVYDAATGAFVGDREPRRGHDFAAERFVLGTELYAADGFFGNVRADTVAGDGYARRWSAGLDTHGKLSMAGGADHVFVAGTLGDAPGLYALAREDGERAWYSEDVTGSAVRPVATRDHLLVPGGDGLYCFDQASGTTRWHVQDDEVGPLAVVDDLVYTVADGVVRALRAPG